MFGIDIVHFSSFFFSKKKLKTFDDNEKNSLNFMIFSFFQIFDVVKHIAFDENVHFFVNMVVLFPFVQFIWLRIEMFYKKHFENYETEPNVDDDTTTIDTNHSSSDTDSLINNYDDYLLSDSSETPDEGLSEEQSTDDDSVHS